MEWFLFICIAYFCFTKANGWLFPKDPFKVCYDSLGCFSSRHPYTNTPGILPRDPDDIGTRFLLTRDDTEDKYENIGISSHQRTLPCQTFNSRVPTKIIIHGYIHSVEEQWVINMVKELLKHNVYNIILVDWQEAAGEINYMQAAANIRVIGLQTALLLKRLQKSCGLKLSDVHIIGHSLGAHAAGYAGEAVKGIGRITGLDPAGPLFDGRDPAVRLDPDDALFVDVIHTDAEHIFTLGFGLKMPLGHVDFYPNGGIDQPGCPTTYFAQLGMMLKGNFELEDSVGCSHMRAVDFFTESINSRCQFRAYPCPQIKRRADEKCATCRGACAIMGFHTLSDTPPGKYVLQTQSKSPFCMSRKHKKVHGTISRGYQKKKELESFYDFI